MTREEIISNLLYMKRSVKEDTIEDRTIDEAIKALEQEPCNRLKLDGMLEDAYEHGYEQARHDFEVQSCEDTISRKHLLSEIDALMQSPWFNYGKGGEKFTHYGYIERKEAVEIVRDLCVKTEPPVTPKPAECEDAVSRKAVLDGLASIAKVKAKSDAQKSLMGRVMFFTEQLPPVTPKQRTGVWVGIDQEPHETWECGLCGFVIDGSGCIDPDEYREIYKYCPHCGAKMEMEGESE